MLSYNLFYKDNNAESQMDQQNNSLLGLCKAEHDHSEIIFASCCEDYDLPGKKIELDYFSLGFTWLLVIWKFDILEAGTLLKACQEYGLGNSRPSQGSAWHSRGHHLDTSTAIWEFPHKSVNAPNWVPEKERSMKPVNFQTTQAFNTDGGASCEILSVYV